MATENQPTAYQVNPVARMAEGGTETQQCSAWVAQEGVEDGLPGRTVQYSPEKLTWNPRMEVWNMSFLFGHVIFSFHVRFRGCS